MEKAVRYEFGDSPPRHAAIYTYIHTMTNS